MALRAAHARRGFTLVEILVSMGIIAILAGILVVAFRAAVGTARSTADQATVQSLKSAVSQFKQTFGFLPPLVRDNEGTVTGVPLTGGPVRPTPISPGTRSNPIVLEPGAGLSAADRREVQRFLAHRDSSGALLAPLPDRRYSEYSLAYYLIGPMSKDVDGVDGPGFRAPRRDGSFEQAGRTVDPLFDVSKNARVLFAEDVAAGRHELRDQSGVAFRYYRWVRGRITTAGELDDRVRDVADLNLPYLLLDLKASPTGELDPSDPDLQKYAPPESKDASAAIVGAGKDGLFGDETLQEIASKLALNIGLGEPKLRAAAMKDNAVEFLR